MSRSGGHRCLTTYLFHIEVDSVEDSSLVDDKYGQLLENRREILDALNCNKSMHRREARK